MNELKNCLAESAFFSLTSLSHKIRKYPILSATLAVASIGTALYVYNQQSTKDVLASFPTSSQDAQGKDNPLFPGNAKSSVTTVEQCGPRITHLTQEHWIDGLENYPEILRSVWRSQQKVAEYLIAHPNAIVFTEGITETNPDPFNGPKQVFEPLVRMICSSSNISPQILNLLKQGVHVSQLLYCAGKVHHLRRSISPERNAAIYKEIDLLRLLGCGSDHPQFRELAVDQRDQEIFDEVGAFLSETREKNPEIVIIFGAEHDFSQWFKHYKFTRIDTTV